MAAVAIKSAPAVARDADTTSAPDPILALIEAERVAFTAFEAALDAFNDLDEAWDRAAFNREPRVAIGEFTVLEDEGSGQPRTTQIIYAHTAREIDADCDRELRRDREKPGGETANAARRARLHKKLADDEAAILAAKEALGLDAADARWLALSKAADEALQAVLTCAPMTEAGLLALIDLCADRIHSTELDDGNRDLASAVCDAVRGILNGRA